MSWDLFSSAEEAARAARSASPSRLPNERLAHLVAGHWADAAFASPLAGASEWTVSSVNAAMREMVEAVFPPLWVVGEVTNFTRARSGHCYFTLRDESSQLRCVMWRDEARRLPTAPAEGMEVRVLGRLSLYEPRGEYQLVASTLEGRGDGLWKLALERLRVKLEAEGLTAPDRKRPLPRCPAAIGVVTSPTGAVLHDIANVVRRRAPWTRIVLSGCRVQGEGAAEEIAAAIRLLGRAACVDVLIIGRGGGSVEDLWAFNEEVVARAIAESPIPTISAVGHETDVTIADLVADLRAPTPSAAAEAAVPDGQATAREVARLSERLTGSMTASLEAHRADAAALRARLGGAVDRRVASARDRVARGAEQLGALSPLLAFNRGFALPIGSDGRVLRRTGSFPAGSEFDLLVHDGVVPCRVEDRPPFTAAEE
jgi:exodeoxyribonuclease VII large subunit